MIFAEAFRSARERRGWTYRTAANKLRISTRTIQNWQNGEHPAAIFVDKRVKAAVAAMMGISEQELLAMLGVLENSSNLALEVVSDGKSSYDERPTCPSTGMRDVLYELMTTISDAHPDWLRLEKVARRGTLTVVRYHTLLGIEPTSRDIDRLGSYEAVKNYLAKGLLRPIWNRAGLHWRGGNPPGWENRSELLIQIPLQEKTRPIPIPRNRLSEKLQLFAIGAPWAHAELLGSFVADALSFGYIDLRYARRLSDATAIALSPPEDIAQALRWSRPGYVISLASPTDAVAHSELVKGVAARSVVIACTYEPVMEAIGRWVYGPNDEEADVLKNLMDEIMQEHDNVINVHFMDDDLADQRFSGDHVQQELSDRACDLTLAAAVDVVRLLGTRYQHVPPPNQWRGHLTNLTDSRGRLNWERKTRYTVTWL